MSKTRISVLAILNLTPERVRNFVADTRKNKPGVDHCEMILEVPREHRGEFNLFENHHIVAEVTSVYRGERALRNFTVVIPRRTLGVINFVVVRLHLHSRSS